MRFLRLEWKRQDGSLQDIVFTVHLRRSIFTLFVSAKAKSTVSSLATALVFCVLPVLMTSIFPEKVGLWMQCLLPAGGISMGNSFLYALVFFAVI